MANLRDIRKRIASVKNTQKITNAMKMVSAAKLRRAEESIKAARPYSERMREVLLSLAARVNPAVHPLLQMREPKKVLLILVTADRGLCGAFNANLSRRAEAFSKEMASKGVQVALITVGRKGNDYFRRRNIEIAEKFVNVMNSVNYELAGDVVSIATEKFASGEYDEVYILYNSFRTAVTQILTLRKLLPVTPEEEGGKRRREYLYEPSEDELLSAILPRYVQVQVFTGLLDSVASEHGARMTAMEAATTNADEMIYKLTLKLNRLRQESITTELMEIVGGAEALKG
ncbi:ATP synthase F1 subunit gamma [Desulfomonile tiedjei]|uniref:ATP synthase gamma chain n=1 Tax=Desulfomonile tiedjei (strain ATCC 49306 / DSM 6799 / DCB-1) TaxID=706587 RepID=I4C9W0_DESTA|nr:ATP synthase F1 subunit gamma [Desulfomonile tiedjei]AFM26351.1 ATP synthase F1 subcomplex gamma subunit [Desulfomonile tiedjei DSM 6799]